MPKAPCSYLLLATLLRIPLLLLVTGSPAFENCLPVPAMLFVIFALWRCKVVLTPLKMLDDLSETGRDVLTVSDVFNNLNFNQILCFRKIEKLNKKVVSVNSGIIFNETYIYIYIYLGVCYTLVHVL